eukprot:scaffold280074_cov19-Prasinocladus_malaysianus.AAC.1
MCSGMTSCRVNVILDWPLVLYHVLKALLGKPPPNILPKMLSFMLIRQMAASWPPHDLLVSS